MPRPDFTAAQAHLFLQHPAALYGEHFLVDGNDEHAAFLARRLGRLDLAVYRDMLDFHLVVQQGLVDVLDAFVHDLAHAYHAGLHLPARDRCFLAHDGNDDRLLVARH